MLVDKYDNSALDFPVKDKHYLIPFPFPFPFERLPRRASKIEAQNNIDINVFGYENKQFYPIYVSTGSYEELNLLLTSDGEKQHYVSISDFAKLMCNKTQHKEKKHFCMHCLQVFSSKEVLIKHKENCISINGKQGIQMPKKEVK